MKEVERFQDEERLISFGVTTVKWKFSEKSGFVFCEWPIANPEHDRVDIFFKLGLKALHDVESKIESMTDAEVEKMASEIRTQTFDRIHINSPKAAKKKKAK